VQHSNHAHVYGTDPLVACLSYGALSQCLLGYEEKALKYGKKAFQHAKNLKHPFSLVFALNHHCWLHQFYKETELVDKFASELVSISSDYGFPFWQITGMYFKGWVLSQTNKTSNGIEQMEQCIKGFQGTGAGSVLPYFMTAFAEAYLEKNQPEEAFKWLENAEAIAQKNSEHFFDAEIYRVRGEALFKSDQKNKKNAESLLWRAIETARRQKAKALELRAVTSLVRIAGAKKETLKLLNETYKWFKEGLDTQDLRKANKLLQ
jgi:predicted ATPase